MRRSDNAWSGKVLPSLSLFVVVVCANWDTVTSSPGVNDNGSGVVALLEVARLLSSLPVTNTIIFAVLDKERAGYQGSKAFIRDFLCPLIVRQFRAGVQVRHVLLFL